MRKRNLFKQILTTGLCLTMISATAEAYSDVSESNGYAPFIEHCVSNNFLAGYTDGTFKPDESISNAEMLVIMSTFTSTELPIIEEKSHWADAYLINAQRHHWIDSENIDLEAKATRLEVAEAMLKVTGAIPNPNLENPFIDVDNVYLNTLYDMKIITGAKSEFGVMFNPDELITRAEICVMLTNMNKYLNEVHTFTDFRYLEPIVGEPLEAELTPEFFENLFLYMYVHNIFEYEFRLPGYDMLDMKILDAMNLIEDSYYKIRGDYIEYGAFWDTLDRYAVEYTLLDSNETLGVRWEISLSNTMLDNESIIEYKTDYLLGIGEESQKVYNSNQLTRDTSDYDIAQYFFSALLQF